MAINVILFGQLIEKAGRNAFELEDVPDTDQLAEKIHQCCPELAACSYRIAVDRKLVTQNTTLVSGVTVALLPPFSGG